MSYCCCLRVATCPHALCFIRTTVKSGTENTHTFISGLNERHMKRHYLYGLAVVDLDYVEVKTVNPFAWCDEITPLFVKILSNIYKNLRKEK